MTPTEMPVPGPLTDEHIKTVVTIYAAVVATSALLLNFKSWFDTGVKLRLDLMADAVVTGGDPRHDEKDLVILKVTNRGGRPDHDNAHGSFRDAVVGALEDEVEEDKADEELLDPASAA